MLLDKWSVPDSRAAAANGSIPTAGTYANATIERCGRLLLEQLHVDLAAPAWSTPSLGLHPLPLSGLFYIAARTRNRPIVRRPGSPSSARTALGEAYLFSRPPSAGRTR